LQIPCRGALAACRRGVALSQVAARHLSRERGALPRGVGRQPPDRRPA